VNVVKNGGKVHYTPGDQVSSPACNPWQGTAGFKGTDADVSCKKCLTWIETNEPATTSEGEIMAENATGAETVEQTPEQATMEQISANIERARSLAEAENAEGLAELDKETKALISSLPRGGKTPEGKTWAGYKAKAGQDFRQAAAAQPKPEPKNKPKAEVNTIDPKDYSVYAGVTELIADGAVRVAEGVNLHLKTADLAKDVASIMLDMWRRIPNKDNNPDILGTSHAAKEAARALYAKAGEGFEQDYDTEEALKKLQRAVQHQRSDVRAQYLRSLDSDTDEQKRYAKALEGKPEDVSVSQFIADAYGTQLKGHGELQRELYHAKKALSAGNGNGESIVLPDEETEGEAAEAETPDVRVRSLVRKLKTDVKKAKPEDFESASDETKEAVRAELEELYAAVKAMITATL
jgi:tetratricopeptide (TPR) repeat protein